jgi:hypothetical protein
MAGADSANQEFARSIEGVMASAHGAGRTDLLAARRARRVIYDSMAGGE